MDLNQKNPTDSDSAETKEYKQKEWCTPQIKEFAIGQLTTLGTHCAHDNCNSSWSILRKNETRTRNISTKLFNLSLQRKLESNQERIAIGDCNRLNGVHILN